MGLECVKNMKDGFLEVIKESENLSVLHFPYNTLAPKFESGIDRLVPKTGTLKNCS